MIFYYVLIYFIFNIFKRKKHVQQVHISNKWKENNLVVILLVYVKGERILIRSSFKFRICLLNWAKLRSILILC